MWWPMPVIPAILVEARGSQVQGQPSNLGEVLSQNKN